MVKMVYVDKYVQKMLMIYLGMELCRSVENNKGLNPYVSITESPVNLSSGLSCRCFKLRYLLFLTS